MKKIMLLALLLAGTAGAGFWFLRPSAAPDPDSDYYAACLPADTWAVLSLFDLRGLSRSFPDSAPGKFFAKETMRGIIAELGADEAAARRYEEFYDGAADLFRSPILQQLFGDDATLALLAPDPDRLRQDPEAEQRRMLLIFGSSAAASPVASLARLTMSEVSREETAAGLELTRIRLDEDESLYGTVHDGLIILAYSPETVAEALRQQEQGGGLDSSPQFVAAQKFWAEEAADSRFHAKFYTNIAKLRATLAASGQPEAERAAARLQGFTSLSAAAAERQGELRFRSRTESDPARLNAAVRQERERLRGQRNLALHLLNEQSLLYFWFSGLERNLFAAADPASLDEKAQNLFGLPFAEVMAALGPQAAVSLGELASTGLFPVPTVALAVQARQLEQVRQLFASLRGRLSSELHMAREQTTEAAGLPLHHWNLLPAEAAHPALALNDKLLYFANGESRLKHLLAQEQEGLPQAMRQLLGPELAAEFSQANSAAFVLRPARLTAALQQAAVWLQPAFPVLTEKLRAELTQLFQPLDLAVGWSRAEEDHALSLLVLRKKAVQ
ncbi:MAG: DUF3352 domain-containing protein [Candidatus Electronema sp. V4]|uniref:DUF3352 domain-containing protein n=1 Tax=Candidatus Electronema sp. V4 TaxID=3454756 RepID=UPI0040555EB6